MCKSYDRIKNSFWANDFPLDLDGRLYAIQDEWGNTSGTGTRGGLRATGPHYEESVIHEICWGVRRSIPRPPNVRVAIESELLNKNADRKATIKFTPMNTLKRVSGRLKELLRGRKKVAPVEAKRLHLLVVDDEDSIRFSMGEYFSSQGFKVDTARELEEAETLIKLTDYNVIIQDLQLGLRRLADGLEVIKFAHEWNPDTRIIVLTSDVSADIEEAARRAGADAFLSKPKPLSQVAQVVQGLISSPRKRTASV